jgi:hypothetical protein
MKNLILNLSITLTDNSTKIIDNKYISFLFLIVVICIFVYIFSNCKEK